MAPRDQMRKGSTDFVILSLLARRPMYGYEISQSLERNGGYFEMKEGLLYPALHRMQEKGWLTTEWRVVEGTAAKILHADPAGPGSSGGTGSRMESLPGTAARGDRSERAVDRMTIDEVLMNISIHLHLSKESEHEILAEIRYTPGGCRGGCYKQRRGRAGGPAEGSRTIWDRRSRGRDPGGACQLGGGGCDLRHRAARSVRGGLALADLRSGRHDPKLASSCWSSRGFTCWPWRP